MLGSEILRARVRPVQGLARRAWRRTGSPFTAAEMAASCVVVAPHPDDETLGCGATMAQKVTLGARVRVVVATDGAGSHAGLGVDVDELVVRRQAEAREACSRLGVSPEDVVFFNLPDGNLAAFSDALSTGLRDVLDEEPAEQLMVTASCDGHPDHEAVAVVARAVVRDLATPPQVWEYPVWMWTHWPFTSPRAGAGALARTTIEPARRFRELRPRTVATAPGIDAKRAALDAYRSQVGPAADASLPDWFVQPFLEGSEDFFPAGSFDHLGSRA